jgi:hypothetical protein
VSSGTDAGERARRWLEQGRQIGKSLTVDREGRSCYVRVAIEKRDGGYEVLVDEIDERRMEAEEYERDERRRFDRVEDAAAFIEGTTPVKLSDLAPSRGQKWF